MLNNSWDTISALNKYRQLMGQKANVAAWVFAVPAALAAFYAVMHFSCVGMFERLGIFPDNKHVAAAMFVFVPSLALIGGVVAGVLSGALVGLPITCLGGPKISGQVNGFERVQA